MVLGHAYWTTRLGADPNILNQVLIVNGQHLTVVGVAPSGFRSTTLGLEPEVFVPNTMRGLMSPGSGALDNRRAYWAYLFARLKPGVSVEQAAAGINAVYRSIITDVEAPLQTGMSEQGMTRFLAKAVGVEDGRRGQSQVHGEARVPMIPDTVVRHDVMGSGRCRDRRRAADERGVRCRVRPGVPCVPCRSDERVAIRMIRSR